MTIMPWCDHGGGSGQLKWDRRNYYNIKTQNITIPGCCVDQEQLTRLSVGIKKEINSAHHMIELSNKGGRQERDSSSEPLFFVHFRETVSRLKGQLACKDP